MYLIPIEQLKIGDIILTSENSSTSKIVRASTKSDFSHAILHVGSGSYIHSDAKGVHSGNVQRLLFDIAEKVTILRVDCSPETRDEACIFARSKIGTKYSIASAINSKLKISKKKNENRQFCSRLVAQAYEYAGFFLVKDAFFCTPEDILNSPKVYITPCKARKATDSEVEFSRSKDPMEWQATITNEILSKVRDISQEDIQSLNQITQYVISHPEHDKEVSKIYIQSGYLTMWEYETKKNAWRYNGELFIKLPMPINKLIDLAKAEKSRAIKRLSLYKKNLEQYFYINKTHKLEYSKIHFELYKKLVENTLDNIMAAEYVLENI